jgi:hypothetical protein
MKDFSAFFPRDLIIDLNDMTVARALDAHKIVSERTTLKGKNARGAEGQLRFRILEQGFQEICEQHGGALIENGLAIGDTVHRIYQPFMRFSSGDGAGVILAIASMPAKGELPHKNESRKAGVMLNYHVTPRLALDRSDPQLGDTFVLFLTARDRAKAGQIEEVAIGVIDSKYEGYALYETIEQFMARYATSQTEAEPQQSLVRLKRTRKLFVPPEAPEEVKAEDKE